MTTLTSSTVQMLSRLNAQFIANFVGNDVAGHDALLHQHFTYRNGSGARIDRDRYLKNWATGFDPDILPYWDLRDEVIVVTGGVALVSAVNRYVEVVNGRRTVGMAAYTDTYVFEQAQWTCIHAQITPVDEVHWPGDHSILRVYLSGVLQTGHRLGVP